MPTLACLLQGLHVWLARSGQASRHHPPAPAPAMAVLRAKLVPRGLCAPLVVTRGSQNGADGAACHMLVHAAPCPQLGLRPSEYAARGWGRPSCTTPGHVVFPVSGVLPQHGNIETNAARCHPWQPAVQAHNCIFQVHAASCSPTGAGQRAPPPSPVPTLCYTHSGQVAAKATVNGRHPWQPTVHAHRGVATCLSRSCRRPTARPSRAGLPVPPWQGGTCGHQAAPNKAPTTRLPICVFLDRCWSRFLGLTGSSRPDMPHDSET